MSSEANGLTSEQVSDVKISDIQPFFDKVTLIVYGWRGNEPGTLSWVFPSLGAAMAAVRALRNAARWLIVAGTPSPRDGVNVEEIRRTGVVLLERFA
ncbi:MAG: hypothetical protein WCI05_13315 [Myxococcales bacterium]|jgi:hypothetical protein